MLSSTYVCIEASKANHRQTDLPGWDTNQLVWVETQDRQAVTVTQERHTERQDTKTLSQRGCLLC